MGFFERFTRKKEEEVIFKPIEKKALMPSFEVKPELEALIQEATKCAWWLVAIAHDHGIYWATNFNEPKIQQDPELRDAAEQYQKSLARLKEIKKDHGEELRSYLKPYMDLKEAPEYSLSFYEDEWNRIAMAQRLKKTDPWD